MVGRGKYAGRSIGDLQEISSDEVSLLVAMNDFVSVAILILAQSFNLPISPNLSIDRH